MMLQNLQFSPMLVVVSLPPPKKHEERKEPKSDGSCRASSRSLVCQSSSELRVSLFNKVLGGSHTPLLLFGNLLPIFAYCGLVVELRPLNC